MEVGFSLGSNLGDRLGQLSYAKQQLLNVEGTEPLAQSKVYETEPVGVKPEHQDKRFLNTVLVVDSERSAEMWIEEISRIEYAVGRERSSDRFAPRTLDIDLLYTGERCVDGKNLTVPHPRWAERRFVVQPLSEVRPDLVLPGTGGTVREVLNKLPNAEEVELWGEEW